MHFILKIIKVILYHHYKTDTDISEKYEPNYLEDKQEYIDSPSRLTDEYIELKNKMFSSYIYENTGGTELNSVFINSNFITKVSDNSNYFNGKSLKIDVTQNKVKFFVNNTLIHSERTLYKGPWYITGYLRSPKGININIINNETLINESRHLSLETETDVGTQTKTYWYIWVIIIFLCIVLLYMRYIKK